MCFAGNQSEIAIALRTHSLQAFFGAIFRLENKNRVSKSKMNLKLTKCLGAASKKLTPTPLATIFVLSVCPGQLLSSQLLQQVAPQSIVYQI